MNTDLLYSTQELITEDYQKEWHAKNNVLAFWTVLPFALLAAYSAYRFIKLFNQDRGLK